MSFALEVDKICTHEGEGFIPHSQDFFISHYSSLVKEYKDGSRRLSGVKWYEERIRCCKRDIEVIEEYLDEGVIESGLNFLSDEEYKMLPSSIQIFFTAMDKGYFFDCADELERIDKIISQSEDGIERLNKKIGYLEDLLDKIKKVDADDWDKMLSKLVDGDYSIVVDSDEIQ